MPFSFASEAAAPDPLVSVIIPLYESQVTVGECLRRLQRQTFRDFEVILVDSSPHDAAAKVSRTVMPEATYLQAGRRLLPQAARNLGAERARGGLLVFTDPDIYPRADWLERLVAASRERPSDIVLGSIACYGRRWIDRGVHFCKFNICLPGGRARAVPLGWSGNVAVERRLFESLGGWHSAATQGDSIFSARARAAGHQLWFEPRAVVEHDHEGLGVFRFVRERFRRGREFAALEATGYLGPEHSAGATSRWSALKVLILTPLRVAHRVVFVGRAAADSRLLADYWMTLPIVLGGVSAWYAGMCAFHWNQLTTRRRPLLSG